MQVTQTDKFAKERWVKSLHPTDTRHRFFERVHYRLVTKCAGFKLSTFKGSRELLSATFDVFISTFFQHQSIVKLIHSPAVMDAHLKARTLHRDISLGNIILYKSPHQQTRVGYLIDWELGCKIDKVGVQDHVITVSSSLFPWSHSDKYIKGTPAFVSIATSYTATNHTYSLKDDLESILYIVLYCALQWLPVTSPQGLYWWLAEFFSVEPGKIGGAALKATNATRRHYTSGLETTRSQAVLDWLNATMDLHYHADGGDNPGGPNPAWNDGKALEGMWKKTLEWELPEDDRCENPVPDMIRQKDRPLAATYTTATTSTNLFVSRGAPLPPPSTINTGSMSTGPSKRWDVTLPPPSPATTKRTASESFSTDGGTESFDRNPNRRRGSSRGGEDTKRRRTDSHLMPPPPFTPNPSRRPHPPPAERGASRSSTRRSAGRP